MKALWFGLAARVNSAVAAGRVKCAELNEMGMFPDRESIAFSINSSLDGWAPKVAGQPVLDAEDRKHLALALAGMVIKLAIAEKQEGAS